MEQKSVEQKNSILVVDDDKSVRDFLALFLKKKGCDGVSTAETGAQALEFIAKEAVRLVLLDIMLPDMNGLEVLHKIKQLKPGTGVIMITGFPEQERAKQAMKEGAYDFIVKPFDLEYLELSVLTKILLDSP